MPPSLFKPKIDSDENWISVSDLMAGLMMVFLFILIIYAKTSDQRLHSAQEVAAEWRDTELIIYQALKDEFEDDLERWDATIEKETLTIRFSSPDILFQTGNADLRPKFKDILNDFMPRYIDLLVSKFPDKIEEVRIEGHTSSEWNNATAKNTAFIKNMSLSQARTRAVLEYSLGLPKIEYLTPWMFKTVSANGLSSSHPILDQAGNEDKRRSKRVDFKIKTNAQEALFKVIDKIAPAVKKGFK
mgnify:CR=1 FL=1